MPNAERIIELLGLRPLPFEGGYYRETYRAAELLPESSIAPTYDGDRHVSTAIYYALTPDTVSAMHRLRGDEIFHFYLGDPVEMLQLRADGTSEICVLGHEIDRGMQVQLQVPRGTWQGSRLMSGGGFALMGTTMAPGFDVRDFEAGDRRGLIARYPEQRDLISALTPDS